MFSELQQFLHFCILENHPGALALNSLQIQPELSYVCIILKCKEMLFITLITPLILDHLLFL